VGRRDKRAVPRIHAITNDAVLSSADFVERARAVMDVLGTRGAVHLRAHALPASLFFRVAEELAHAQRQSESSLVVNDRIDIALAAGARGVQLTSHSISVSDALTIAGGMLLGASVHTAQQAVEAARDGAHWLIAGSVYATPSHKGEKGKGEDFISEIAWCVQTPVIAIGGILPLHVRSLRTAGAHGVAAIRGIWGAADAAKAAADYLSVYDSDGDI
jgi:thiazole tautomerase (transcriptional regulator TenI)